MKNDDAVFRHLKRTTKDDFLEALKAESLWLPDTYIPHFLNFAKFCEKHQWTYEEGMILLLQKSINEQQEKIKVLEKTIQEFKPL